MTSCFFIFPTAFDANLQQTPTGFNYTCVVVGGVLLLATVYWVVSARHFFKGPGRSEADGKISTKEDPIAGTGE